MPIPAEEVGAARRAARDLLRAVDHLSARHGADVDLRRLHMDAQRVAEDLELLAGPDGNMPQPGDPVMIPDHDYPPEFWTDADRD